MTSTGGAKVILATCPACNKPVHDNGQGTVFLCDCGTMHCPAKGSVIINYGAGAFTKEDKGEKVYLPFWKVRAVYAVDIIQEYSGYTMLRKLSNKDTKPDVKEQEQEFLIPAYGLDPINLADLTVQLNSAKPSYLHGKLEIGIRRLPCVIPVDMVDAIGHFAFLALQAKAYPGIQNIHYTFVIMSQGLLYLPYYQHRDHYKQGF